MQDGSHSPPLRVNNLVAEFLYSRDYLTRLETYKSAGQQGTANWIIIVGAFPLCRVASLH